MYVPIAVALNETSKTRLPKPTAGETPVTVTGPPGPVKLTKSAGVNVVVSMTWSKVTRRLVSGARGLLVGVQLTAVTIGPAAGAARSSSVSSHSRARRIGRDGVRGRRLRRDMNSSSG